MNSIQHGKKAWKINVVTDRIFFFNLFSFKFVLCFHEITFKALAIMSYFVIRGLSIAFFTPTGVRLVMAGGLRQDLTFILSTENTKQKFIYCRRQWRGTHCEEYMLCVTDTNNILENAICDEGMLCITASFIVKKICCVLLPASLGRRYSCLLL